MDRLLNTDEAAAVLNVSPWTLRHDARDGKLGVPVVRIGRAVRYRPRDLERWISRRVSVPGVDLRGHG